MSIIIKKKPKFNKKKIIQRTIVLILIYFVSFFSLYFFFGERELLENIISGDVQSYANDGEKFLAHGDYSRAIEYYLKEIDSNPENYIAYTNLSVAYAGLKEFEKAKFYVFKSKELAPNYYKNFTQIADIYILESNYPIAETAIDAIPAKTKESFLEKANMLIKLSDNEPDLDDKIIHYERALAYLKRYDYEAYKKQTLNISNLFFKLADVYISKNDIDAVKIIYPKILKYRNDCDIYNKIAIRYQDISDEDVVKYIIEAAKRASTQDEKRLTKENLIKLKYYFEKKGDNENIKLLGNMLALFDESVIENDKRALFYTVEEDNLLFIGKSKKRCKVTFSLKNKSNRVLAKLYAKVEVINDKGKVIGSSTQFIVKPSQPLSPNIDPLTFEILVEKKLKIKDAETCTVSLSFSKNSKDWFLYKVYNPEAKLEK